MSLADLDRATLLLARTRGHSPRLERVVAAYSKAGEHGAGWITLGLAGAALTGAGRRRRAWLRGVRIIAGAYAANQAIKFTVRRRRPELPGLGPLTSTVSHLSFPSAHATTSFAAARAYDPVAPRWALYIAALTIGLSRPYLGVHYPSDVLAGAALGTALADLWP